MSDLIDNRARRIETLKHVVKGLHDGEALESVRARLASLVHECDASEVAAMEQQLLAEGVPAAQIMGMCDLHSQAVRGVLGDRVPLDVSPGHPVDTFRRENAALREQVERLRAAIGTLGTGPDDSVPGGKALQSARAAFGLLMDVDKHYRRKEHLLFPFLEKRGITGPSTVMWGKDDQARALLKELGKALEAEGATASEWRRVAQTVADPALAAVEEMVFKEERILLPMSLQALTEAEWGEIWTQSPQIGYCIVDPLEGWRPPSAGPANPAHRGPDDARDGRSVVFPTGSLSLEQLTSVFSTLPVDLTFVDAEDRVRFFSEGENRVFHRAKAVIGRKVQHCHPPASVGTVDRILSDFRSGSRSVAEFWIQMRGRFVHIRYFAVRDAAGTYLGTLEVTQDLTRERGLQGERRLLQYEG